jgi:hypothetical protein
MAQAYGPNVDSVICHEVTSLVFCTFEDLVQRVQAYSWAQVFSVVDRLSREGTLTVSRTRCFGYVVSNGPAPPLPGLRKTGRDRSCLGGAADLIHAGR